MNPMPRTSVRIAAAALLAAATACSSPKLFQKNREILASSSAAISNGSYAKAEAPLEHLVIDTNDAAPEYALQRFYAAVLLTRLQIDAALSQPFMKEPVGGGRAAEKPSWLAHLVASTYDASYATDWAEAAGASGEKDRLAQLPPDLASYDLAHARSFVAFVRMLANTRLGFQEGVADALHASPELLDVKTCEQEMETARVSATMRPWILWGIFEYEKTRDEPRAYKFGIRARETAREAGDAFDQKKCDEIVDWILHASKFDYVSSAGMKFDPASDFCTQSGQPNIDFTAVPKADHENPAGQ